MEPKRNGYGTTHSEVSASAPSRERENVLMSDSGLQAAVVLQLLGHLNCMHVKPLCT